MFDTLYTHLDALFGIEIETILLRHMIVRGLLVYVYGLILVRLNERFVGIRTQFNFVLFIMMGSIFAGAIGNQTPFFPTLGMMTVLIVLNWILARLAYYSPTFENFLKGKPKLLVNNGKMQRITMQATATTERDLIQSLRLVSDKSNISDIKKAYLETNGKISFILE